MSKEKSSQEQVVTEQPDKLEGKQEEEKQPSGKELLLLSLTALGVVYGDIGTSPLYAFRFAFIEGHIPRTGENVLGVLSLIFWSLIIVISIKYLVYIMKADNEGEGGILALMALLVPSGEPRRKRWFLVGMGVFGAALLYGDGMITPAISVLSAIEGLKVATPVFNDFIVPITVVILILLFVFQKKGTRGVGRVFGPVMLFWFVTLGVLGVLGILKAPGVLWAVNPEYAVTFFFENGWRGFLVLGAVFLVVTGGEALYADMGHFGKKPIRLAWFAIVLPGLLLNYFGQGALYLSTAKELANPFYSLAPEWALYPLVGLSTLATIIASQAVISGAFSLTRQAVLLGELPRIKITQTSSTEIGQIYIPMVNWILLVATILLVIGFQHSENLAAAYGVAVTTTMVITTLLGYVLTREKWGWNLMSALSVTVLLLIVDMAFFAANMTKISDGGWFPLVIGGVIFVMMATWRKGRHILKNKKQERRMTMKEFLKGFEENPPKRVPGTAIFMTGHAHGAPPMLIHHLQRNKALHEQVLLLTVEIRDVPKVWRFQRLHCEEIGQGFYRVKISYGFMQNPHVPNALREIEEDLDIDIDFNDITYYIGRNIVSPRDDDRGMSPWREELFAFMSRNAAQTIEFFDLPSKKVIEIGKHVEI